MKRKGIADTSGKISAYGKLMRITVGIFVGAFGCTLPGTDTGPSIPASAELAAQGIVLGRNYQIVLVEEIAVSKISFYTNHNRAFDP